jgi:hypothetical protein
MELLFMRQGCAYCRYYMTILVLYRGYQKQYLKVTRNSCTTEHREESAKDYTVFILFKVIICDFRKYL